MLLASTAEMRLLERQAEVDFGLSPLILMENAGARLAEMAARMLGDPRGRTVAVVAGSGNNGGDGLVAARHLQTYGARVHVFTTAQDGDFKGQALPNYEALAKMATPSELTITRIEGGNLHEVGAMLAASDLIIDALLGTGLRGPVAGLAASVIRAINAAGRTVLAADVPSGMDASTGQVSGDAVQAAATLTFGLPKIGLYLYPGAEHAGEVVVADIGLPARLLNDPSLQASLITADTVGLILPARSPNSHKGSYGHALMLGGSPGLTGAVALAGQAALCSGAGLVTVACPSGVYPILAAKLTEVMTLPLPDGENGLSGDAAEVLIRRAQRCTALGVGPGMGTGEGAAECLKTLLGWVTISTVIDADALRILAAHADTFRAILQTRPQPTIMTPHPGEMAGLTGLSPDAVAKYRTDVAREVAQQWNAVVVLKGAHTVIAAPSGQVFINTTGNPGLASGGTGDVLTGIITGLSAQGLTPLAAATAGVYLHGLAGDCGAKEVGEPSLIAGDVIRFLPQALRKVRDVSPPRTAPFIRPA